MLENKRKYIFNVPNLKPKRQSLRNNATNAERLLWSKLKNSQLGVKFRRQFSVGGYILDFYCPSKRLALELDGEIHKRFLQYDQYRSRYLDALGIKTIRFWNPEIEKDIDKCLEKIKGFSNSPS